MLLFHLDSCKNRKTCASVVVLNPVFIKIVTHVTKGTSWPQLWGLPEGSFYESYLPFFSVYCQWKCSCNLDEISELQPPRKAEGRHDQSWVLSNPDGTWAEKETRVRELLLQKSQVTPHFFIELQWLIEMYKHAWIYTVRQKRAWTIEYQYLVWPHLFFSVAFL